MESKISLYLSAFVAAATLPCLASNTNIVTNTNDSGSGSLRAAITCANSGSCTNLIQFDIPPFDGSVKTIAPLSQLPNISRPVIIDGYTQDPAHSHPNTQINNDDAVLLIALSCPARGRIASFVFY